VQFMKAILVIDVPVLDDGRHLCNECPIWNKEHYFCQYDFNMETKGCPLRPIPNKACEMLVKGLDAMEKMNTDGCDIEEDSYCQGWNECIDEILGEQNGNI